MQKAGEHDWVHASAALAPACKFGASVPVASSRGLSGEGHRGPKSLESFPSMAPKVVIVGGGLAGLSAACELLERGCNIVILEKSQNLGGANGTGSLGLTGAALEHLFLNGVAGAYHFDPFVLAVGISRHICHDAPLQL